jgi:hypothetical protein
MILAGQLAQIIYALKIEKKEALRRIILGDFIRGIICGELD